MSDKEFLKKELASADEAREELSKDLIVNLLEPVRAAFDRVGTLTHP